VSSQEPNIGGALRSLPYLETIDQYQKVFAQMCEKLEPFVGEITLKSILANMLDFASEEHECFQSVEHDGTTVDFFSLQGTQVPELQESTLRALEFFFEEFIQLIGDLTSDFYTDEFRQLAEDLLKDGGET
jgi:hypothetical protein